MSMDTPTEGTESGGKTTATAGAGGDVWRAIADCWKARESLWVGLIVLLLAVIGQILLVVVPSQEWLQSSEWSHYRLHTSLGTVAQAAMLLGAVWVGVYLARWGLSKKKD